METSPTPSKEALWTGRVFSGLPVLILLLDAGGKFAKPAPVIEGTLALGYPESVLTGLGVVLLTITLLYAVPRTAVLGATDRLSGWRDRFAPSGRKPLVFAHFVSRLFRHHDLGRPLS